MAKCRRYKSRQSRHEVFVIEHQPMAGRHWTTYWTIDKPPKVITGTMFPEMRRRCRQLEAKRPEHAVWPKYRVAAYSRNRDRTERLYKCQRSSASTRG